MSFQWFWQPSLIKERSEKKREIDDQERRRRGGWLRPLKAPPFWSHRRWYRYHTATQSAIPEKSPPWNWSIESLRIFRPSTGSNDGSSWPWQKLTGASMGDPVVGFPLSIRMKSLHLSFFFTTRSKSQASCCPLPRHCLQAAMDPHRTRLPHYYFDINNSEFDVWWLIDSDVDLYRIAWRGPSTTT